MKENIKENMHFGAPSSSEKPIPDSPDKEKLETIGSQEYKEFIVEEIALLDSIPDGRMEEVSRTERLRRWMGTMVLMTALAGFFGNVTPEVRAQAGRRERQVTRIGTEIYEEIEKSKMEQLEKKRRVLRNAISVLENEIRKIERDYRSDIREFQKLGDTLRDEELTASFEKRMEELRVARDTLNADLLVVEQEIEKRQKRQSWVRKGIRILEEIRW